MEVFYLEFPTSCEPLKNAATQFERMRGMRQFSLLPIAILAPRRDESYRIVSGGWGD